MCGHSLLATQTRLELATSAVTGRRANQLRYWAFPHISELLVCSSPLAWQQTFFDVLSYKKVCKNKFLRSFLPSAPNGVRTRVTAVKGRCPRPLDDGDVLRQSARVSDTIPTAKLDYSSSNLRVNELRNSPFC